MPGGFSSVDYKIIGWYARDNNLKPQLSIPPMITFLDKNGKEVIKNVKSLRKGYDEWVKQEATERARTKRREAHDIKINRNRTIDERKG